MDFKENLAGKGKLYPVFLKDDGDMHSVRISAEKLDLFQIIMRALFEDEIILDPEPLNNCCTYKIQDNSKK